MENKFLEVLSKQQKADEFSHAYLVLGEVDEGSVARFFMVEGVDLFVLNEGAIKIGNIRKLIAWINIKPHSSAKKLAILKNVENMTLAAANCLLKVLEEPPKNNILILQSQKKERILPTIMSRCQMIREMPKDTLEAPVGYINPSGLIKMSCKEKFDYVDGLIKKNAPDEILKIINFWEIDLRQDFLSGRNHLAILKRISLARTLLLTNTSVKLLLENLILEF